MSTAKLPHCDNCVGDELPFTTFGRLVLCARCSAIVIESLSSSADSPPSADQAAVAFKPTPNAEATAATLSNPRSPNSPIDGAAACVPDAHSQAVVSNSESPPVGEPAPAAVDAVAPSSAAAGVHDMPDIPAFLDRRRVA
jgi:hypothetical protein